MIEVNAAVSSDARIARSMVSGWSLVMNPVHTPTAATQPNHTKQGMKAAA
jgi:hypothetical protein